MSASTEPMVPQPRPHQSSLSSYPDYSPTDSRWLPELPRGWSTNRLKFLATINPSNVDKRSKEDEESVCLCNYTDVYYENEITEDLDFMEATASLEEIQNYSLQENDVIVTKDSESWDDIAVPAFVPRTLERVLCGYHLAIIRPIEGRASGRFLSYAFQAGNIAAQLRVEASGITRYGLTVRSLQDAEFPVPPLRQQTLIADFLDQKTSKIDRLIDKKERLIKLLEERRTALITKAVTKGLDPDVPMKNSGVEWLGEIPEHWDTVKVKYLADYINGYAFSSSDWGKSGKKIIRIQNLTGSEEDYNHFDGTLPKKLLARPGDILIPWSASLGAFRWEEKESAWVNQHIYRAVPHESLVQKEFFLWLAKVFMAELEREMHGSAMQHVTQQKFGSLKVPLPPQDEQDFIARRITEEEAHLKTVESRVDQAIQNLEEYRSALITAAVTGEIDVRDQVA